MKSTAANAGHAGMTVLPLAAPRSLQAGRLGLRGFARAWEQLALYLPVVMMGLLALGTYWLVQNTPGAPTPAAPAVVNQSADYFMRRANVKTFDANGRLKTEVAGTEARHFPHNQILEIDDVRVRSLGPDGRLTTATAKRGLSNDAGNEIQLIGDAVVVREAMTLADGRVLPRLEFRGEFLHAFTDKEQVRSHLPVTLRRGGDEFKGDTFRYDNLDQVAELQGRVKALMVPRQGK